MPCPPLESVFQEAMPLVSFNGLFQQSFIITLCSVTRPAGVQAALKDGNQTLLIKNTESQTISDKSTLFRWEQKGSFSFNTVGQQQKLPTNKWTNKKRSATETFNRKAKGKDIWVPWIFLQYCNLILFIHVFSFCVSQKLRYLKLFFHFMIRFFTLAVSIKTLIVTWFIIRVLFFINRMLSSFFHIFVTPLLCLHAATAM